jgi:hypothetical protein
MPAAETEASDARAVMAYTLRTMQRCEIKP